MWDFIYWVVGAPIVIVALLYAERRGWLKPNRTDG